MRVQAELVTPLLNKDLTLEQFQDESLFREMQQSFFIVTDSLYSAILSIFHEAMGFLSSIFDQKDSESLHKQLSKYYFSRAFARLEDKKVFTGDSEFEASHFINFSLNTSGIPNIEQQTPREQLEFTKNLYGEEFKQLLKKVKSKNIKINGKNLHLPINQGVCLGACLDFLEKFLRAKSNGKPTIESIQEISADYVYGAPKRAQMLQIMAYSIFKNGRLSKILRSRAKSDKKKIDKIFSQIKLFPHEKFKEKILDLLTDSALSKCKAQYRHYISPTGSLVNLRASCESISITDKEDINTKKYEGLKELFSELKEKGSYTIDLSYKREEIKTSKHIIVYIKESDQEHYLFDPNYGTKICTSLEEVFNSLDLIITNSYLPHSEKEGLTLTGCRWKSLK